MYQLDATTSLKQGAKQELEYNLTLGAAAFSESGIVTIPDFTGDSFFKYNRSTQKLTEYPLDGRKIEFERVPPFTQIYGLKGGGVVVKQEGKQSGEPMVAFHTPNGSEKILAKGRTIFDGKSKVIRMNEDSLLIGYQQQWGIFHQNKLHMIPNHEPQLEMAVQSNRTVGFNKDANELHFYSVKDGKLQGESLKLKEGDKIFNLYSNSQEPDKITVQTDNYIYLISGTKAKYVLPKPKLQINELVSHEDGSLSIISNDNKLYWMPAPSAISAEEVSKILTCETNESIKHHERTLLNEISTHR